MIKPFEVSIIIVHFNTPDILKQCIDSIYKYCSDTSVETIIVDNHSQLRPITINQSDYINCKIIYNKSNLGFSCANNIGAQIANGKYLFFVNSDTLFESNLLQSCKAEIELDIDTGIVGPRLLNEDRSIQYYGSAISHFKYRGYSKRSVPFLSGAAMFIRKKDFENLKGFDEHFFFYNEDVDLCIRMKRTGKKLIYLPETTLVHLGGKSTKKNIFLQLQSIKGALYLFNKLFFQIKLHKTR